MKPQTLPTHSPTTNTLKLYSLTHTQMNASTLPNTSHHPSLAFTVLYRTCPLTLTHRASLFHLHALLHTTLSPAFTSSPCAPSLCTCFRPTAYSPPTLNHAHFIPLYDRPSSSSFHFHNPAHPSHSFIHSILTPSTPNHSAPQNFTPPQTLLALFYSHILVGTLLQHCQQHIYCSHVLYSIIHRELKI